MHKNKIKLYQKIKYLIYVSHFHHPELIIIKGGLFTLLSSGYRIFITCTIKRLEFTNYHV